MDFFFLLSGLVAFNPIYQWEKHAMKMRSHRFHRASSPLAAIFLLPFLLIVAGCGLVMTPQSDPAADPTVTITPSPASISAGGSSTLTVSASDATQVTVTGSDGSSYNLSATRGKQGVSPTATATVTVSAQPAAGGRAHCHHHRESRFHHRRRHVHTDRQCGQRQPGNRNWIGWQQL